MAQAGQDPALHQQHALLGLGLVPGFTRAGRQDGHLVVLGPLLVAGVDIRVVAAGFADPVAQVIGDNERGDAFDAGHGPGVATQPVRERLGPGGLGKGVIGGAEDGNKESSSGAPVAPPRSRGIGVLCGGIIFWITACFHSAEYCVIFSALSPSDFVFN